MNRARLEYLPGAVVALGFAALLVAAVLLVSRENAASAAADAEVAISAESVLSAASATRNAAGLALVVVANAVDDGTIAGAVNHLRDSTEALVRRARDLAANLPTDEAEEVLGLTDAMSVASADLSVAIESEATDSLVSAAAQQATAYESLATSVGAIRDNHFQSVEAAGQAVGRAANTVRFLIVFLIPLGLMIALWRGMRRNSARRLLEAEIERQRAVLQSKDDFIADISHELRTPLTGIYGFASVLADSKTVFPADREIVSLIVTEAADLARMVDDLIIAGRLAANAIAFKMEGVELEPEIVEVVRPFRQSGIHVELDGGGVTIMADRLRLRQVLRNLVSNAVRYGDGEVAVETTVVGDMAVIDVLDNGPGVSHEVEDRLFQRYVHRDGSAVIEGSVGLGLSIARALAEGMSGGLHYEHKEGLTRFSLRVPLARGRDSLVHQAGSVEPASSTT